MPLIKLIPYEPYETVTNSIVPARTIIPHWYKSSKQKVEGYEKRHLHEGSGPTATYKQCVPFLDAMTLGYVAVLTSDIEVTIENNTPTIRTKNNLRSIITHHDAVQWAGMPLPANHWPHIFKWHQDIVIKTPARYSILFTHPFNRLDLPFTTISGVVDTDNYEMPSHFPFWLKHNFEGLIEAGTPVAHIVPIKREKWTKSLLPFDNGANKAVVDKFLSKIERAYKTMFWEKKHYE
jgi:hypothetical protein